MSIVFPVVFLLILGMIIFNIAKGISQWNQNNHSPVLSVEAVLSAKRSHVTHHNHMHNDTMTTSSSTDYYLTFEVESGDRMEFRVSGREFGLLAEGDMGTLTFQGTRYLGFDRT